MQFGTGGAADESGESGPHDGTALKVTKRESGNFKNSKVELCIIHFRQVATESVLALPLKNMDKLKLFGL